MHPRAAGPGARFVLDDEKGGAFAHRQAIAPAIERPAGVRRVARRRGAQAGHAAQAERVQHRIRGARDDDVVLAALDQGGGVRDGERAGGAGGDVPDARTGEREPIGDGGQGAIDRRAERHPREARVGAPRPVDAAAVEQRNEVLEKRLLQAHGGNERGAAIDRRAAGVAPGLPRCRRA